MDNLESLVILNHLVKATPSKVWSLIQHFGSATNVLKANNKELAFFLSERNILSLIAWQKNSSWKNDLKLIDSLEVTLIPREGAHYPESLLELEDPPLYLYAKGNLDLLKSLSIAVIGTREPSSYGLAMARSFTKELCQRNYVIVSGLARGIDTAAHQTALDHGSTIAVLGCGLNAIYPPDNQPTAQLISEKGLLLSEYPLDTRVQKHHLLQRNRIITALSIATLFVEGNLQCGSMDALKKARSLQRPIFTIPGPLDLISFAGNHHAIREGMATLVTSCDDITSPFANLFSSSKLQESLKRVTHA